MQILVHLSRFEVDMAKSENIDTRSAPHPPASRPAPLRIRYQKKADIRTRPANNRFLNFLFYFNRNHIQYIYL
jgi:hypothetical protein